MTPEFISRIRMNTTVSECEEVWCLLDELSKIEHEELFVIALMFKLGVIQGKQIERARRKSSKSNSPII